MATSIWPENSCEDLCSQPVPVSQISHLGSQLNGWNQPDANMIPLLVVYPSEKYEFVSWDDDIPNWMEK